MKKKVLIWVLGLISVFMSCERIDAYSTAVHEEITKRLIKQIKDEWLNRYINDYIGLASGVEEVVHKKQIRKWIEEGSKNEDYSFNPKELLTSHFHNPLTNKGLTELGVTIGESAYDRANNPANPWSWQKARENLYKGLTLFTKTEREKALAKSFEALGHLVHLVQDMAIPAHTRDDMHVPYVDGDPYENYTHNNRSKLNYTAEPFLYWNVSVSPKAPKQFWDADTYDGSIPHGSGYIGLSEYTNANFFSKATIFKYFPHPAKESTNYYDFSSLPIVVITTPDNISHETLYIKDKDYNKKLFAGLKYFAEELWNLPDIPLTKKYVLTPHLDNRCHEEYASKLIPRAVGYSAGLLKYFFRGSIAITLPDTGVYAQTENRNEGFTRVTLLAKNTTPDGEEMADGSIELVVKYRVAKEDPFQSYSVPNTWEYSYIVVPELNGLRSIPRANPIKLEFDLSQNPIPINATDLYLQIVYKGVLGQEEGAVAVGFKDISEPTPIDIYNGMDRVCLNGNWYVAGSPEAIAQVDTNNDGRPDLSDPYAHNLKNIYIRFSSETDPQHASSNEYNIHIPSLAAGEFYIRRAFILSDYQFSYGYRVMQVVNTDPNDPWVHWYEPAIIPYPGLKNQTELATPEICEALNLGYPCYIRYYPMFNSYRGVDIWDGLIFENTPYPPNSSCP